MIPQKQAFEHSPGCLSKVAITSFARLGSNVTGGVRVIVWVGLEVTVGLKVGEKDGSVEGFLASKVGGTVEFPETQAENTIQIAKRK